MTPEQKARWVGDLLAIDPAIRSIGAALYRDGALLACGRVVVPKETYGLPMLARCVRAAHEVAAWWLDHSDRGRVSSLVCEWPQIYRATKSKGDPNDLPPMAGVDGACAALLAAHCVGNGARPPEMLSPMPREWAGQLPKDTEGDPWTSPRGVRVANRLEIGERSRVPAQHDAMDACAIGLWALGRWEQRRAFSGAVAG